MSMHQPILTCLVAAAVFCLPAAAQKSVKVFVFNNAESFLLIGEAMGTEMRRLLK
jgi:hypothetical protein